MPTTRKNAITTNAHDSIELDFSIFSVIDPKIKELYEKGLSLREVAAEVGLSKTKVRKSLLQMGVELREKNWETPRVTQAQVGKRYMRPPYGFCYFEGAVVREPREYPVLRAIIKRWKDGESLCSIARWLNGKGVPSALNKRWSDNSVKLIIQRIRSGHLAHVGEEFVLR